MGWDYSVYVKARPRTRDTIRELAARMAKTFEGELVDLDELDEDAAGDDNAFDLGFSLPTGEGRFAVERLKHGYKLYTDSQMTSRHAEAIEDIGGLMDLVASELGTVIEESEVIEQMIAESEAEPAVDAEEVASVAVVRAEDRAGAVLEEVTLDADLILAAIDGAGMLRDVPAHPATTEEGRYTAKIARLTATLFDGSGHALRRHEWSCDGYGRIIGARLEELT